MSDTTTIPTPADIAPKPAADPAEPVTLPADHPLVKTLAAMKDEVKTLKTKAARLDEIEEASKTAEQKAAERLAEAERRAAEIEARATRAEVAASTGLPIEILAGPKGSTVEAMTEYAALVKAHFEESDKQRKQHNNIVPREGATPRPQADERSAFADYLTGQRA